MPTYFVTGCGSGIGKHLARVLLDRGDRVVATGRDVAAVDAPERLALDVRDPDAWERALDAAGDVDVLLNVAGYSRPGWIHEATTDDIHRTIDVNLKGAVFGTRAAARRMVRRGSGHIVNMASMAALVPVPGISLYCASKYALRGFSLAAAQELRPHGVAVTVVCPDAVRTPMLAKEAQFDAAAVSFSAPRILTVEDVAKVVLEDVLPRRPLEVFLPRGRGRLCRLLDMFPSLALSFAARERRRGERNLAEARRTWARPTMPRESQM